MKQQKVKVLSLFDGMACGHIAMQQAGLETILDNVTIDEE